MTNVNTTTPVSVAGQGTHVAPVKAAAKIYAAGQKSALKARKPGKGAKAKQDAREITQASKPQAGPRTGSKSAKVLALLARPKGATLVDLMNATEWQAHSVRGFLSTASRKRGIRIESFKSDNSKRIYRVKK